MKSENGAWPCFYCLKKFKGAEFVVKHIDNKHATEEKYLIELQKVRDFRIFINISKKAIFFIKNSEFKKVFTYKNNFKLLFVNICNFPLDETSHDSWALLTW